MAKGPKRSMLRRQRIRTAMRVEVPERCDVCVVGGGAAGLAAGIAAAEAGASVVVLDAGTECGLSILATGNGRCNLANVDLSPSHYNDPAFVGAVMGPTPVEDVRAFFEESGLALFEVEDGRLFPRSLQAASVRNVLLARAQRAGVVLAAARPVVRVASTAAIDGACSYSVADNPQRAFCARTSAAELREAPQVDAQGDSAFEVAYGLLPLGLDDPFVADRTLAARTVVLATGGTHARELELPELERTPLSPALCPLACSHLPWGSLLAGRSASCELAILREGEEVFREAGIVLFRSYGLSGIVTFNASRVARQGDTAVVDLLPEYSEQWVRERLEKMGDASLDGLIDPEVAHTLIDVARNRDELVGLLKHLSQRVEYPAEPEHAQVMRGGLATSGFHTDTLESTGVPGLFACGEALDVDGACGGYNLSFAWLSGLRAGKAAARR